MGQLAAALAIDLAKHNVEAAKEARLSRHRLTAQPPEPTRIGRWKTALTADELGLFNKGAGNLLHELGYEK